MLKVAVSLADVEDVVRSEVPQKTLDETYETKNAMAVAVRESLKGDMKWYGYEVVNALVTDIVPNAKVRACVCVRASVCVCMREGAVCVCCAISWIRPRGAGSMVWE